MYEIDESTSEAPLDDIDRLADEIAVTACRIDSATHELLTKIRRFDEAKGWARQGAKSCAHWLSWRIGCGPNAASEKVRVATALAALPRIDAALRAGEAAPTAAGAPRTRRVGVAGGTSFVARRRSLETRAGPRARSRRGRPAPRTRAGNPTPSATPRCTQVFPRKEPANTP